MTTATASIVLSDDEVVAIALHRHAPWPSPLPSLAERTAEDLARAVRRGMRSLMIRELTEDGEVRAALVALLAPVLEGRRLLLTYLATDDDLVSAQGTMTACYQDTAGSWLIELVTPEGIHRFDSVASGDYCRVLAGTVESVLADGLTLPEDWSAESDPPTQFCVSGSATAGRRVLSARRGSLQLAGVREDGSTLLSAPSSARDGIDAVLAGSPGRADG